MVIDRNVVIPDRYVTVTTVKANKCRTQEMAGNCHVLN